MSFDINKYIVPTHPYNLIEVVEGVSVDTVEREGLAEYPVDNKYEGQHMDICKVLRVNYEDMYEYSYEDDGDVKPGDYILVWSTAVKPFDVRNYGRIFLVKNADIFCKIDYEQFKKDYESQS